MADQQLVHRQFLELADEYLQKAGFGVWSPRLTVIGFRVLPGPPTVCKIMAFRVIIMGLGLLFYIFLGFR